MHTYEGKQIHPRRRQQEIGDGVRKLQIARRGREALIVRKCSEAEAHLVAVGEHVVGIGVLGGAGEQTDARLHKNLTMRDSQTECGTSSIGAVLSRAMRSGSVRLRGRAT